MEKNDIIKLRNEAKLYNKSIRILVIYMPKQYILHKYKHKKRKHL